MVESEEFFLLKEDALRTIDEVIKNLDKLTLYDEGLIFDLYSQVHTLKGEAGFFGMAEVADTLHSIEDKILEAKNSKIPFPPEIIEDTKRKMVFIRARIASARSSVIGSPQDLRDLIIGFCKEYSAVLGKKINFHFGIRGEVLNEHKKIFSDIVHIIVALVRNGLEHAVEPESTRVGRGKNPLAEIKISLEFLEDNAIKIHYSDDGAGFPPNILEKIKKEGIESIKGFSSKELPTIHSGRGMGLYTIYKIISAKFRNGVINIESQKDKGTVITISFELM